jgi:hypothetical protein
LSFSPFERGKPPLKIPDGRYPHNTKRACTILLFAKKIKKFISIFHKHLAIFVNRKIENFRTKRASLCKGWGATFFLELKIGVEKEQKYISEQI